MFEARAEAGPRLFFAILFSLRNFDFEIVCLEEAVKHNLIPLADRFQRAKVIWY
jgi:hypothetical protein